MAKLFGESVLAPSPGRISCAVTGAHFLRRAFPVIPLLSTTGYVLFSLREI